MQFNVSRDKLVSLIGKLQSVVPSKAVIPILSNILVEASGNAITIYATDLTVSIQAEIQAEVIKEGSITLPSKRFFQLIRELTAPEVSCQVENDGIAIITSGTSVFRLHGMDKEEYPAFPDLSEGKSFVINAMEFKSVLSSIAFAAARDDSRQVLNGIFLDIKGGKATFVGTDGKRLAKIEKEIDFDENEMCTSIIPLKAVEEMLRILEGDDKATITLMSDKIALEVGSITLFSKLLSGQFPDYERVIPDEKGMQKITLHRDELSTLLKQVSLFACDKSHSVRLTFSSGDLKIQATNSDIGEGKVHMPVDYQNEQKDIAFNPTFFLDILRHCKDETINFGMTDSFNPGLITDSSNANFVLMPMRLSSD